MLMKNTLPHSPNAMRTLCFGALALVSVSMWAGPLTPEQALARALPAQTRATGPDASADWKLVYTSPVPGQEDVAGCYYYKSEKGFVVASADDRAIPLLAYGDDTEFDADNLSPEFEWWLGEYGRQMAAAPDTPHVEISVDDPKGEIAPLCHTKWNQFGPYYDMCSKAYGQPVVTGCVATALAQVLKYHNWPATGDGERTYTSDGKQFSFDYGTADFDWAQMADDYTRKSSEESKNAVSELMYACGVAVGMHYHPGGSGADPAVMCYTLPQYMKYNKMIYNAQRFYYSLTEWNDLIYDQLQKYGPVQYSGYVPSGGGHSFVCDGYSQGGFFHINWGWGGASDGYYVLTALAPNHSGLGYDVEMGGFNFNQDAIINIYPDNGIFPNEATVQVMNASPFSVAQKWQYAGREINIRGAYWNTTAETVKGQFGVAAVPEAGDTVYMPGREITDYWSNEGLGGYNVTIPADIKAGTYTLTPAFYANGTWLPIKTAVGRHNAETMTVAQDGSKMKATFSPIEETDGVAAIDVEAKPEIDPKHYYGVKAVIQNTGDTEWLNPIGGALFTTDGKLIAYGMRMELDIPAGQEETVTYSSAMKHIELPDSLVDGPAVFYLVNYNNLKPISEAVKVTITGESSAVEKIELGCDDNCTELQGAVKVYTLQGVCVAESEAEELPANLEKGIYILVDKQGHSRKVAI